MITVFFDRQDSTNLLNGTKVASIEGLSRVFDVLRNREPFFCELVGQNGYNLLFGLSPDVGCAQYSAANGSPPFLMAVGDTKQSDSEEVEFLTGNTATPVSVRYCLPIAAIEAIAAHFVTTGNRWKGVSWEEI